MVARTANDWSYRICKIMVWGMGFPSPWCASGKDWLYLENLRKTARGASSPANPALHIPELSQLLEYSSSSYSFSTHYGKFVRARTWFALKLPRLVVRQQNEIRQLTHCRWRGPQLLLSRNISTSSSSHCYIFRSHCTAQVVREV